MKVEKDHDYKILIVDDEPTNLRVIKEILLDRYQLSFAKSGEAALTIVKKDRPDLILLDVMMPGMTGFEVCKTLKNDESTKMIPVIFVTALSDDTDETMGFEVGGVDYITKPVSPAVVKARVKTHLSLTQVEELRVTRLQIIQRLGKAAEYKDNETGMHVMRMSHYSQVIALAYGLTKNHAENILNAAPMHDIGKIGIPDNIILKPGKLTDEEFAVMKTHPQIGAEILGDTNSELLCLAKSISLTHHEKWDGTGYPNQLKGEEIPIEGRIVAITDVFDALTSKRPYKEPWSTEKTMEFIHSQKNKHFDPDLVDILDQELDKILKIKDTWID